jgi:double-stranded uracil-DNA glycosylase
LEWGIGITNLVDRTTATAAELSATELREGSARLEDKVRSLRPRSLCFLGMGAYRSAFRRPKAGLGLQEQQVAGAAVWLAANPSGLQARYGLDELAGQLAELRAWLGEDRGAAGDIR